MSHHNDICRKCYENINGCECHLDDNTSNRPNKKQFRTFNNRRTDKIESLIGRLRQRDLLRDKNQDGIPEE